MQRSTLSRRATGLLGTTTALVLLGAGLAGASVGGTTDPVGFSSAVVVQPGSATSAGTTGTALSGGNFAVAYPCVADDPATGEDETMCPMGTSTTAMAGFPTQGSSFGVLSTGNVADAPLPNLDPGTTTAWEVSDPSIGADVHDYQIARIDLGPATSSCLAFDFKFLSEEYPEFVNEGFNDAFIAQLNTWSVTVPAGTQTVVAPGNFAAGPGDEISVDAAGPSAMSPEQASGTTYDASTLPLVARRPVTPGTSNSLFLTLFDQGDEILDSAVFVDNLRYENLPASQCKSLALDPAEGTTAVTVTGTTSYPVTGGDTLALAVTCDLPPGPIPCTGAVSVTATSVSARSRAGVAKPSSVVLGTTSMSIPGGATSTVAVPLTAKGQALVAAQRAKPAQLKKQVKKAKKKAKALAKKAKKLKRSSPARAKQLTKKAAKKRKAAKKLSKKWKKLTRAPLASAVVSITNPANGATSTHPITIAR